MVAILRAVALNVLIVAITLHIVGFVTSGWVTAKLHSRDSENSISAPGMGVQVPRGALVVAGIDVGMGLWKVCMTINLGRMAQMAPGMYSPSSTDICKTVKAKDLPDWWKAVQALGILSLITAVVGVATVVYSIIVDSKGDRPRLLPHGMTATCLLAGALLLIALVVYGAECRKAMDEQLDSLAAMKPGMKLLTENLKLHVSVGYSFAMEAVSGVLMVLVSLPLALPVFRGRGF